MAKSSAIDQLKWICITTPTAAAGAWTAALTLDTLITSFPQTLIDAAPSAGATLALGAWTLAKFSELTPRRRQYRRAADFAQLYPMVGGGWQMRYKEIEPGPPPGFEFVGQGLPIAVPEMTMLRFLRLACRRQNNALFGSRYELRRTGDNWKRLTANQILSEDYYLRRTSPRFEKIEYDTILIVLGMCRLIAGRGPGRSGKLREASNGPTAMLDTAKSRWVALVQPPARRGGILAGLFTS